MVYPKKTPQMSGDMEPKTAVERYFAGDHGNGVDQHRWWDQWSISQRNANEVGPLDLYLPGSSRFYWQMVQICSNYWRSSHHLNWDLFWWSSKTVITVRFYMWSFAT